MSTLLIHSVCITILHSLIPCASYVLQSSTRLSHMIDMKMSKVCNVSVYYTTHTL